MTGVWGDDHAAAFAAIDRTAAPGVFIGWMDDVGGLPGVVRTRQLAAAALDLSPGQRVLDVGCGAGDATVALAHSVDPRGRVVGVDASSTMLAAARDRAQRLGLAVDFPAGDALDLPFRDGAFDACRCERVLVHVPDTERALAEMVRVTRPGGRVAVVDIDGDATLVDSPDRDLTRIVVTTLSDSYRNGWIGRQLLRLFGRHGLTAVSGETVTASFPFPVAARILVPHLRALEADGTVAGLAIRRWWDDLEAADQAGTFFFAITLFVVAGQKPG